MTPRMEPWQMKILADARGELGAAIRQSIPSDDQIIMARVKAAYEKIGLVLSAGHTHVSGTTVGLKGGCCAVCGEDFRHENHQHRTFAG